MVIKVYVNWEDGIVLSAKEFEDVKKDKVADILNSEYDRANYINEYLHVVKGYDYADLLYMEEEDRREIGDLATKYIAECVDKELEIDFQEFELEV